MDNSMFGYVCMISVEGIELFRAVFHITSQQWCTEGRGVQTPPEILKISVESSIA